MRANSTRAGRSLDLRIADAEARPGPDSINVDEADHGTRNAEAARRHFDEIEVK
jgi:hypothetical protein